MLRCRKTALFCEHKKSERCDMEVGAPENRIEWLKPNPDAPARKPQMPVLGWIVIRPHSDYKPF